MHLPPRYNLTFSTELRTSVACYICFLPVRILDGCYSLYNELSKKEIMHYIYIRHRYKKIRDSRPFIISLVRRTWRSFSMHLRKLLNISGINRNFFSFWGQCHKCLGDNTIQYNSIKLKAKQCHTIQCYNLYLTRSNVLQ